MVAREMVHRGSSSLNQPYKHFLLLGNQLIPDSSAIIVCRGTLRTDMATIETNQGAVDPPYVSGFLWFLMPTLRLPSFCL